MSSKDTDADEIEVSLFHLTFSREFDLVGVQAKDRTAVAGRAIQILCNAGDLIKSVSGAVVMALRAAAFGGEKFEMALRYAQNIATFGSIEKALAAAASSNHLELINSLDILENF